MIKFLCPIYLVLIIVTTGIGSLKAQELNSSQIQMRLQKLNVLASVMYLAAHPDDENTRVISYMANHVKARTSYLSLTRGDGGQNLIGSEKGALMGILRTNELLGARNIDGGEQCFTRAVDFGYSKNPEETFTKWDKNEILSDVVWAIRRLKPDVIITRFSMSYKSGHGHHSASAILADLAFDASGNREEFADQLKYTQVWQPHRMFFNNSTWWDKELEETAKTNKDYTTVNSGIYDPLLGASYADIASESRSMHKSQGFGDSKERGESIEYLQLIKGEGIEDDVFDGIDITWGRVDGGAEIQKYVEEAIRKFNPEDPSLIVPDLLQAYSLIIKLKDQYWKGVKTKEIKKLILACSGIYIESNADYYSEGIGNEIGLTSSIVVRSGVRTIMKSLQIGLKDTLINADLEYNKMTNYVNKAIVPVLPNTNAYWLEGDFEGIYKVENQLSIGLPTNEPTLKVGYVLEIEGVEISFSVPLKYWWNDLVNGEMYRPFFSMPSVTANLDNDVFIFASEETKKVSINIKSHTDNVKGEVKVHVGTGWGISNSVGSYSIESKGGEQQVEFKITAPAKNAVGEISISFEENARSLKTITYSHIESQVVLPLAKSKIVSLNVKTVGKKIGYITGSGDNVPSAIEQLGYEVVLLGENELRNSNLSEFDAIVAGVRLYNTHEYIVHVNNKLMEYVKAGGNYVVQYNTNYNVLTTDIGPYPFKISRDRVTVEEAKPTFLDPNHPLLNTPNKIEESDFDNWVQERGLYFPDEWDENYSPIISWSDPGEDAKEGSILVSNYGKGTFVYTGISFFRELPAGVPGAFKLFANILSYRNSEGSK
ncbi:MAG: PIG-L family deacetylase [Flavobacteriales bacterium]|nr:PIG-L family deacetylase [Flavobacteriales bacterium]